MITNRERTLEDYLEIGRRHIKMVVLLSIVTTLAGFGTSYLLTPQYTSQSLLVVEPQIVPTGYVKPIITQHLSDRMMMLEENVLSRARLQPMIERLGLAKKGKTIDDVLVAIQQNVQVTEVDPNAQPGQSGGPGSQSVGKKIKPGEQQDAAGFYVSFTGESPQYAQEVCAEITSMLLSENLRDRQEAAQGTEHFLSEQLQQAKQNLDDLDKKLSDFKKLHLGRLPGDEDTNLKILAGLNTQLDAVNQSLSRAQQDKAFAESVLAQQSAAIKALHDSPDIPSLREKLISLEDQLVDLKSRYTEDHPDVIKTEKDIADLKAALKQMNNDPSAGGVGDDSKNRLEAPEILQLRAQIHQSGVTIARATQEQKRLEGQIDLYEGRLSLSPDVEEQYKQLTRDNETAHTIYDNLLTNQSAAQMQTEMEQQQQGEQVKLIDPASLPTSPSFPTRWKFALGGLAAGLGIALTIAFWKELRDKAIRNEADVLAALQLPVLVSVPWLGSTTAVSKTKFGFWSRFKTS